VLSQYLTHTVCSPSRAGLLTGRHYTRVGSGPQIGGTLRLDVTNVASDLQSNGYATAAFGKWHNGYPNFPADGNGAVVPGRGQTDPGNDKFENYKGIPWGPGVNAYGFDEWQGFYGGATDYFDRWSPWHNDIDWWTNRRYTPSIAGHTVDILEVRASQTGSIDNADTCGLFVKFATAGITDYATEQLEPGDLLSFDLFVASDSDHASGFFVTPGRGLTPLFDNATGVTADGNLMVQQVWPRERWLRVTAGVGEVAPLPQVVDYIALRSAKRGDYHFYLDNVAIRRHDGSTKAVIWASRDDTLRLRYRYCGSMYNEWESVAEISGFPFSEVSVQAVE